MYKKLEIFQIFNSVKDFDELEQVCSVFKWLIEKKFIKESAYLHSASQFAFRRLTQ